MGVYSFCDYLCWRIFGCIEEVIIQNSLVSIVMVMDQNIGRVQVINIINKSSVEVLVQLGIVGVKYEFVIDIYRVKLLLFWELFCYFNDFVFGFINIIELLDIFKFEKDIMEFFQIDYSGFSVEVGLKEVRGRKSFGEINILRQVSVYLEYQSKILEGKVGKDRRRFIS